MTKPNVEFAGTVRDWMRASCYIRLTDRRYRPLPMKGRRDPEDEAADVFLRNDLLGYPLPTEPIAL